EGVVVEPMTEQCILWRCLHNGPLSRETMDRWPTDSPLPLERYRRRNMPLLLKLTRVYGACAIVAREGDRIVGQLRFYPKVIWDLEGAGGLCLQQDAPSGPVDELVDREFPPLVEIRDKTLVVHCLMTGSPQQRENPYQRKGLGSRMVRMLIEWAKGSGWCRIEAYAFEDLPIIYDISGSAGHTFWEKLGFLIADRYPHPDLQGQEPFIDTLEKQAEALGISPRQARDKIVMRLDLASRVDSGGQRGAPNLGP
ncbi:MAG TPA: GNAT family N-acetyltransferase, partial [Candidatus Paceibacterota bacterium]|nr:GNAT family N-acetyltransferase [Candidatus Paceibacterota bacterium]